ncbi:MAG: hypothetical protein ACXAC7_21565 [Candidatus Hodarchaeales archaeon]
MSIVRKIRSGAQIKYGLYKHLKQSYHLSPYIAFILCLQDKPV